MKKIIFGIIIFISASALSGCNGMLDDKSYTNIPKDQFFKNASEADRVLLGVYRNLATDELYGYSLSMLFDLTNDLAQCEGSAITSFREIPTNSFNASNSQVLSTWKVLYSSIYDANDFIETAQKRIGTFSESDIALTKIYIAEAKALRAMFYLELVRWYGKVPLILDTKATSVDPATFTQADQVDIYKYIETNLKEASQDLPWSKATDPRSDTQFRLSRGAALGLLARLYVTWAGAPVNDQSKWQLAATTAGLVCNSGHHKLLPDFTQLWKNTCNGIWDPSESLVEVSFYSPTVIGGNDGTGRIGKWNGVRADELGGKRGRNAANVKVVYTFIKDWSEKRDPRYAISVADYQYKGAKKEPYSTKAADVDQKNWQLFTPAKWDGDIYVNSPLINNDKSNINWYVMRYAEVVLLYAEATNEHLGPTQAAIDAVNMVRRRGHGKPMDVGDAKVDLESTLSQEELRQAIRRERAYELCFEGQRRQDLVRWGIYYQTIRQTRVDLSQWYEAANFAAAGYTIKGKHELFPIPQRELDLMKRVKQNPKW